MQTRPERMSSLQQRNASLTALRSGGLVLWPTDTLWSVGGDGSSPMVVERLCNLRGDRNTADFELLVDDFPMLYAYVERLHPRLETLMVYHKRPLTVMCRSKGSLPERLLGPDRRLAVRVVRDAFTRSLLHHFGKPLVTCFATREQEALPTELEQVEAAVLDRVDYVVERPPGPEASGTPSVIVSLSGEEQLIFHRE